MRMSSTEEYGLRCLLQLARQGESGLVSIPQIAEAEGLSPEYAAKLLRILREAGLVHSTRGANGGYRLARPASEITVREALAALDGPLFPDSWCSDHTGRLDSCVHWTGCSIRVLFRWMGAAIENVLDKVTLADMAGGEGAARGALHHVNPDLVLGGER